MASRLDHLAIQFHFGGTFQTDSGQLKYVGGQNAMSYIDMDKISLPEIKGHLSDHMDSSTLLRLHWLKPGMQLSNGLVLLIDDVSCQAMCDHTTEGGVAEVYAEGVLLQVHESDAITQTPKKQDKDWRSFMEFYRSPCKDKQVGPSVDGQGENTFSDEDSATQHGVRDNSVSDNSSDEDCKQPTEDDSTSDEDYKQPVEDDSSAEDEEALELRKFAKEIKRNIKAKKVGVHGSQLGGIELEDMVAEVPNLDDQDSPYYDSSEDYSYDENSDGEIERWKTLENRYDSKAEVPMFSLGMAFRCSRQFKKALLKYGLKTHKHLIFVKDEKNRVRATCSFGSFGIILPPWIW